MQESENINDGNGDWIKIDELYGLESSEKLGISVSLFFDKSTVMFATSASNANSESIRNNVVVRMPHVDYCAMVILDHLHLFHLTRMMVAIVLVLVQSCIIVIMLI